MRATDKQVAFARKMQAGLGIHVLTDREAASYTKRTVSELINTLIQRDIAAAGSPRPASIQAADWPTITSGYYAVMNLGTRRTGSDVIQANETTGQIDFFRVDAPEDGKWKGCIFVKRVLGGGYGDNETRTERVPRRTAETWLKCVQGRVAESQAMYGRSIGRCGICNRELTDEESRKSGIGPVCASRMSGA
jgi:hypothetical protein